MTQPTPAVRPIARDLPPGSIVATARRVWIKKQGHPALRPHDTWWIEATTYAVGFTDREMQRYLIDVNPAIQVVRVGDGSDQ